MNPPSGPREGGNTVAIRGKNFQGATGVLFGTAPATNLTVNPAGTTIIVTVPKHSPGVVDITVTRPAGKNVNGIATRYSYE